MLKQINLLLLLVFISPALSASIDLVDPDLDRLRVAYLDARTGAKPVSDALLKEFDKHPLGIYLQAADLRYRARHAPNRSTDKDAIRFLKHHGETAAARVFLGTWLKSLASRGHWKTFRRHVRRDMGNEIECNYLLARLRGGSDRHLEKDALQRWMSPTSQPPACDPVFAWLDERGAILTEHRMTRIARAMKAGETGLVRYIAKPLKPAQRRRIDYWLTVHNHPKRELQKMIDGGDLDVQLFAHAIRRLSRSDPGTTESLLNDTEARHTVDAALLTNLRRRIAISYAREHDPRAVPAFASLPTETDDHMVLEWRIRSAMLHGAWHTASAWLTTLPPEMRDLPQWRYWRARALEHTGKVREADALFRGLAGEHDYHAVLAAARLQQPYTVRHKPLDHEPLILDAFAARDDVVRTRLLREAELHTEASREWREATRDQPAAVLKQAAILAQQWGWHSSAIATLARAKDWGDMDFRYPTIYATNVASASAASGIDPAWVYAVARSESLLAHDARSHAGAVGLMQLMPRTAKAVAARIAYPYRNSNDLLDPATNLQLGSAYLSELVSQYNGNFMLAAAAYNAGPHRVKRWLPENPVDADVWVENIPFNETRGYVRRVVKHAAGFHRRLAVDNTQPIPGFAPVVRVVAN